MKKTISKEKQKFGIICILFIIVTVIMIIPLWISRQIVVVGDWSFHASRVEEIFYNLQHGQWLTTIATRTFQGTGVGSWLFYPTPMLYIWAGLRFVFSPLNAFFIWIGLFIWIGFLISFNCMYRFSANKFQSLLFALAYGMLPYRLFLGLNVYTLAEFVATMFLPLAFLGLYEVFQKQKNGWLILSVGMTLILYVHLLTMILITEIMLALFIGYLFARKISRTQLYDLIKSGIAIVFLGLPVIIPFLTDFFGQSLATPPADIGWLTDFNTIFNYSIGNQLAPGIGLFLVVSSILFFKFKSINRFYKVCWWLGSVLVVISTSLLPWKFLEHTPIAIVQMPYRYLSFAGFFLAIVFSKVVAKSLSNLPMSFNVTVRTFGITMLFLISYFGLIAPTVSRNHSGINASYLQKVKQGVPIIAENALLNDVNYQNEFGYQVKFGETDYYPKQSMSAAPSIINNVSFVNDKPKKFTKVVKPNKIMFKVRLKQTSIVNLPVVKYANTIVQVDGRKWVAQDNRRGTVQVRVGRGVHTVLISYHDTSIILGIVLAAIGWLGIVFAVILRRRKISEKIFYV